MAEMTLQKYDEIVMKLLHYFITEEGYTPIILHGAENEIWLENLKKEHQIVRIVTNYIHNDEQLEFDIYRTKSIMKTIKQKTLSLNLNAISIFLNLGDNVHLDNYQDKHILSVNVNTIKELDKNKTIKEEFPNLVKDTNFKEKGLELLMKITNDINKVNNEEAEKAENVFKKKVPYITYILMGINVLVFVLMYILGSGSENAYTLIKFGALYEPLVKAGEYYRLITAAFLHIGIVHLLMNMYALYVVGSQVENFLGHFKYLLIYFVSIITGSLLSIILNTNTISAGASGAIFGLLGALVYFGYHYRIYLGNTLQSQIIPIIILNLALGFMIPGIDISCHIGGLIGGTLITWAFGIDDKSTKEEKVNGWIMFMIFFVFLIYLAFIK
jgi:rhomboid protease GluP